MLLAGRKLGTSPANWAGMGVASVVLVLKGLGILGNAAWPLALLAYAASFAVVGLWVGFPRLAGDQGTNELDFGDDSNDETAMAVALDAIRRLVHANPEGRFNPVVAGRIVRLCDNLDELRERWEHSKGQLSLEGEFEARHIAQTYMPEALRTYRSIPVRYASSKRLANGKTAEEVLVDTLDDLEQKVQQLGDDLASKDAAAFLAHSRFLKSKFGRKDLGLEDAMAHSSG